MKIKQMLKDKRLPLSKDTLVNELRLLGLKNGDKVMVHSSLSSFGYVVDGERAVIDAILDIVGSSGVVLMPSHSSWNSDPLEWSNPPMPKEWAEHIADSILPYDVNKSAIDFVGTIPRAFAKYPGVTRTNHPSVSFLVWGKSEAWIDQPLNYPLGKESQLMKLYNEGGKVLMLGTTYENVTALHLSEYLCEKVKTEVNKSKMLVDGKPIWVSFTEKVAQCEFYNLIGKTFENKYDINQRMIGYSNCKLVDAKNLVDCGVSFFETNSLQAKSIKLVDIEFTSINLETDEEFLFAVEIDNKYYLLSGLEYIYNNQNRKHYDLLICKASAPQQEILVEWSAILKLKGRDSIQSYESEVNFENEFDSWVTVIDNIKKDIMKGAENMNNLVKE